MSGCDLAHPELLDAVIIGGGPAGAAAALTLRKRPDVRVALVEKSDYQALRIGESLSPGVRPLLEYLQVWDRFRLSQSLESYGSQAAWGSEQIRALDYLFTLHGVGWGLDRRAFDQLLCDQARDKGAHVFTRTQYVSSELVPVQQLSPLLAAGANAALGSINDQVWRVILKDEAGVQRVLYGRFLIDASGRRAPLARHLGQVRHQYDHLVGVGCIGELQAGETCERVTQVEACDYGWWYSAALPDNKVSVVLMTDSDRVSELGVTQADTWQQLLSRTQHLRLRAAKLHFADEPRVFNSSSSLLNVVGGRHWLAVGDAVASHDPLSSSGIPHAIGSGVKGAITALSLLVGMPDALAAYQEAIHADFHQYRETHWRYYQRENRWPASRFWARRRTGVTLDPNSLVTQCNQHLVEIDMGTHLPHQQLRELFALCDPGMPVHQIVRAFGEQNPNLPDQRLILAMQEIVERGWVDIGVAGVMPGAGHKYAGVSH